MIEVCDPAEVRGQYDSLEVRGQYDPTEVRGQYDPPEVRGHHYLDPSEARRVIIMYSLMSQVYKTPFSKFEDS